MQYHLSWMELNVSIAYSAFGSENGEVALLVAATDCPGTVCNDFVVRVVGSYGWSRAGTVELASSERLHYEPWGLDAVDVFVAPSVPSGETMVQAVKEKISKKRPAYPPPLDDQELPPADGPYVLMKLNGGPVGVSTIKGNSVRDIEKVITAARYGPPLGYPKQTGALTLERGTTGRSRWNATVRTALWHRPRKPYSAL